VWGGTRQTSNVLERVSGADAAAGAADSEVTGPTVEAIFRLEETQ